MALHKAVHYAKDKPSQSRTIVLSSDGVRESRSSNTELTVWSLRFLGCRHIYPLVIAKNVPGETKEGPGVYYGRRAYAEGSRCDTILRSHTDHHVLENGKKWNGLWLEQEDSQEAVTA